MSVGPPDTKAVLLYLVAPLAISSIVMVVTMVRFSLAVLESRTTAAWRWGIAYALSWAAVLAVILRALLDPADPQARESLTKNLVIVALVVGAFLALHALLLWFGRSLQRANERGTREAAATAIDEDAEEAEVEAEPSAAAEEPEEEPVGRGRRRKKPPRLVRRVVGWAIMLGAVFVAMILGELPPLKALEAWTEAHETPLLVVVGALAGLGFALMMGGIMHMVLTDGKLMTRGDVEDLAARQLVARPAAWRAAAYRIRGKSVGARAHNEVSFAEIKAAWHARAWGYSPRWRRLFVTMAGGLLLFFGVFGIPLVVGPAWVKLIVGAAMLFAATKLIQGFRQA